MISCNNRGCSNPVEAEGVECYECAYFVKTPNQHPIIDIGGDTIDLREIREVCGIKGKNKCFYVKFKGLDNRENKCFYFAGGLKSGILVDRDELIKKWRAVSL